MSYYLAKLVSKLVCCLPKNLPEYIEVNISRLHVGESVHISNLLHLEGKIDEITFVFYYYRKNRRKIYFGWFPGW